MVFIFIFCWVAGEMPAATKSELWLFEPRPRVLIVVNNSTIVLFKSHACSYPCQSFAAFKTRVISDCCLCSRYSATLCNRCYSHKIMTHGFHVLHLQESDLPASYRRRKTAQPDLQSIHKERAPPTLADFLFLRCANLLLHSHWSWRCEGSIVSRCFRASGRCSNINSRWWNLSARHCSEFGWGV